MLLDCGVGEDSWESLECKVMKLVNPKGNQSWIFIGRADAEAETPIVGHLIERADSFEKILMLGKIEGGKRRGGQRMRWLDGITDLMMSLSKLQWWTGKAGVLQSMGLQRVGHDWATELNWTEQKQKILGRGGKNTKKNCTKKIFTTQIITMVWSLTRARHPGMWSQVGL